MSEQAGILDYRFAARNHYYRPHHPWLLAAAGILPPVLAFILLRLRLSQLQRQVGSEILTGSPQEAPFLTLNGIVFVVVLYLECVLALIPLRMVLSSKWRPPTILFIGINVLAAVAAFVTCFALGCEASP